MNKSKLAVLFLAGLMLALLVVPPAPTQTLAGNMTFPPSSTRWFNTAASTTTFAVSLSAANQTSLWSFQLDSPVTFRHIVFDVSAADTAAGSLCGAFADCYSVGIYSALTASAFMTGNIVPQGTLVANCSAQAFNTTGLLDCATVQGGLTLMPGAYYFAFTGTATTAAIISAAVSVSFASNTLPEAGGATTNGVLNSSLTPPADSWSLSSQRTVVFALHN